MLSIRRLCGVSALLAALSLAGCGDDTPPPSPGSFPPLHYGFLPPLRLNVASIDVENDAPSSALASRSPVAPADALTDMAHDRLIAAGPTGTAVFTITDASITNGDAGLSEHLAVHLDIVGTNGVRAGFAEARVTRAATGGDDLVGPASLYGLTQQAMQDMNVEFEYQVRHTLADWLVTPGATVETPVSQTPLGPDSGAAPLALAPGAPATPPETGAPTPLAPPGAPSASVGPSGAALYPPPASYAAPPAAYAAPPASAGPSGAALYPPPVSDAPPPAAYAAPPAPAGPSGAALYPPPAYTPPGYPRPGYDPATGTAVAPPLGAPPTQMSPPPGYLTPPAAGGY